MWTFLSTHNSINHVGKMKFISIHAQFLMRCGIQISIVTMYFKMLCGLKMRWNQLIKKYFIWIRLLLIIWCFGKLMDFQMISSLKDFMASPKIMTGAKNKFTWSITPPYSLQQQLMDLIGLYTFLQAWSTQMMNVRCCKSTILPG